MRKHNLKTPDYINKYNQTIDSLTVTYEVYFQLTQQ